MRPRQWRLQSWRRPFAGLLWPYRLDWLWPLELRQCLDPQQNAGPGPASRHPKDSRQRHLSRRHLLRPCYPQQKETPHSQANHSQPDSHPPSLSLCRSHSRAARSTRHPHPTPILKGQRHSSRLAMGQHLTRHLRSTSLRLRLPPSHCLSHYSQRQASSARAPVARHSPPHSRLTSSPGHPALSITRRSPRRYFPHRPAD